MHKEISLVVLTVLCSLGCTKLKQGTISTTPNRAGQSLELRALLPVEAHQSSPQLPDQFTMSLFGDTARPTEALFRLISLGQTTMEKGCNEVHLLAGEKEVALGMVMRETSLQISGSTGTNQDTLIAVVPVESLLQLSSAETIKGTACDAHFSFNAEQVAQLKKFVEEVGFGKEAAKAPSSSAL